MAAEPENLRPHRRYELARRLRKTPAGRSMRLIAVSGYGQDADRRQAREAGFDDHVVKPPNIDALARVLARTQAKVAG